jgi:hypothetical protein
MTSDTPIVAFRCWTLEGGLRSVYIGHVWARGVTRADCMIAPHSEAHPAPYEDCRCGLYGRTTLDGCLSEYPHYPVHGYWPWQRIPNRGLMSMGAVLLWGTTLRGDKVIRAEYGRVLCLTDTPDPWAMRTGANDPSMIPEDRREQRAAAIDRLRRDYGVPLIPYESVELYVREFGDLAA